MIFLKSFFYFLCPVERGALFIKFILKLYFCTCRDLRGVYRDFSREFLLGYLCPFVFALRIKLLFYFPTCAIYLFFFKLGELI